MRPRVGIALGRPLRTRALSASTSTRQPRRIPPDFPRRAPIYAQTAVDDSAALAPKTEPDTEDKEKPRKRAVRSPGSPNKTPPPTTPTKVPVGPEAIWTSKSLGEGGESRALPPDDMLQDALAQLLVTLQPQTQYRAAYANGGVPLVEPTLALYCPIEGGDYVIDDTVKELAARINGDVIVIDAVQLAAGEHGSFGKAASILNFPQNPLHFPSTGSPSSRSRPVNEDPDTDDDDADEDERDPEVHRVTFGNVSAVAVPVRTVRVRNGASNPYAPASSSSSSKNTPAAQSELKFFFESIINAHVPSASSSGSLHRPRIIYLRDFSLLAPSAHIWYPYLLAAIRARRQGPLLRPSVPVPYPTTLVLGVSPSLVPTFPSPAPPSPPSGLMNMLLGQRSHRVIPTPPRTEGYGSEERADRLRDRLRKWSRSGSIINDLPPFTSPSYRGSSPGPTGFMSANGFTSIFGAHPSTAGDRSNDVSGDKGGVSVGTGNKSGYFRVCGVVPAVRDEARERSVRRARRAEVNALVARMAMGAVGGKVVETPATPAIPAKPVKQKKETEDKDKKGSTASSTEVVPADKMLEDWSRKLLDWHAARRLADRALAYTVLSGNSITEPVTVLEEVAPAPETSEEAAASNSMPPPTAVSWEAIRTAWDAVRLSLGYGDKLADGATEAPAPTTPESATAPTPLLPSPPPAQAPASSSTTPTTPKWSGIGSPREPVPWIDAALAPPTIIHTGKPPEPGAEDEVVEEIKNDPDLDTHEERLLGCIVNPAELQTTFSQVHLPDATIDSVRTLVSLPLLYPAAFRSGILAQHAMTGALLFGPPGTGKTLLARALAKESGARMMVVKPSDYVGEGEKLVRSVFSLARRLSPCIVFLDEIDALLGARSSRDTGGAASAHRGLVTEFMQEMDGLRSSAASNIVVVGATNRPFDLDDAVLRRLPRRLLIDLPGLDEREAILNIMLRGEDVASDVDVKALAKQTEGFSGSDLKNLVVSAALDAVKEKVELPWRTGSAVEKKKEKEQGEKTADVSPTEAANVAPDATSTETPVPGTQTVSEPAPDTFASSEAPEAEEPTSASKPTEIKPSTDAPAAPSRTLTNRHFTRALKEITPSASEALGTLADLRKWNAEFGGGDRNKSVKAWGGRFGFGGSGKKPSEGAGRVVREDAE